MPILIAIGSLLFLTVLFGPHVWIKYVMKRHGGDRSDLPGTGAELARHLLDEAGLSHVKVELTDLGDHYDPSERAVRLLRQHHDGRSVAAVAVAALEVSHAVQHARGERAFLRRIDLVGKLIWIDRAAMIILILSLVGFAFIKAPILLGLQILAGLLLLAVSVLVHLVTLPVEFDASFGKALPVLERGRYLSVQDMPAARSVLKAAAWTYVAAALATLLNIARWLRIFRI